MEDTNFDKISEVMGLSFKCPMTQDNPDVCPLHEFRNKKPDDRCEIVEQMAPEELDKIISYHDKCTKHD